MKYHANRSWKISERVGTRFAANFFNRRENDHREILPLNSRGPFECASEIALIMRSSSLQCQAFPHDMQKATVYPFPLCQDTKEFSSCSLVASSLLVVNQEVPQTIPSITLHIYIIHTVPQSALQGIRIPSKQPHNACPAHGCKHRPSIMADPF